MNRTFILLFVVYGVLLITGCSKKDVSSVTSIVSSVAATAEDVSLLSTAEVQTPTHITPTVSETIATEDKTPVSNIEILPETSVEQSQKLPFEGKIAIICNDLTSNMQEYFSAQKIVPKYGEDKVIQFFYPTPVYADEDRAELAKLILELGNDPEVKTIIINQTRPGVAEALHKLLEMRKDIFTICIDPIVSEGVNIEDLCSYADLVLKVDKLGMGTAMVLQAKELGANTFVHYSAYGHLSFDTIAPRLEMIRKTCEQNGVTFLEKIIPVPPEIGYRQRYDWYIEDMEKVISRYGKDTAFFKAYIVDSDYFMKAVIDAGAICPQTDHPSPYGGLYAALLDPNDLYYKETLVDEETIAKERAALAEKNMSGRISIWPREPSDLLTDASVEYAIKWMNGEVSREDINVDVLKQLMEDYAGVECFLTPYVDDDLYYINREKEGTGETYDNFLLMLMDYITL